MFTHCSGFSWKFFEFNAQVRKRQMAWQRRVLIYSTTVVDFSQWVSVRGERRVFCTWLASKFTLNKIGYFQRVLCVILKRENKFGMLWLRMFGGKFFYHRNNFLEFFCHYENCFPCVIAVVYFYVLFFHKLCFI